MGAYHCNYKITTKSQKTGTGVKLLLYLKFITKVISICYNIPFHIVNIYFTIKQKYIVTIVVAVIVVEVVRRSSTKRQKRPDIIRSLLKIRLRAFCNRKGLFHVLV